jgi:hypothetical protein
MTGWLGREFAVGRIFQRAKKANNQTNKSLPQKKSAACRSIRQKSVKRPKPFKEETNRQEAGGHAFFL